MFSLKMRVQVCQFNVASFALWNSSMQMYLPGKNRVRWLSSIAGGEVCCFKFAADVESR